jgi:starch-binding outer membrane protein, SusD/RagB family
MIKRMLMHRTAVAVVAIAATACDLDKTLSVEDPDVATPQSVSTASGLTVVYAGARAEFEAGLSGNVDNAQTLPGLLADELHDIDTFPTRIEVDQRNVKVDNGTVQAWYRQLHRSRAALRRGTEALHQFAPTDRRLAELHALHGFQYIIFGEDFCNGVAYSVFSAEGNATYGAPQTTTQTFDLAIAQFDSALATAPAGSDEAYLARIGKARALLNKNDLAGAAAAVAGIPVAYQYLVYHSENSTRENNGTYVNVGPLSKRYAVTTNEGTNGLPFRTEGWNQSTGTGDIRVRWYQSGIGQDGVSPAFYELKYPSRSAHVVLADGIEAQLIIAENQLRNGGDWLGTLNALRANATILNRAPYWYAGQPTVAALTPLTDPGNATARVNLLFKERAFWMYLTGHRLGDLRRLIKYYGRSAESVFPTGTYEFAAGGTRSNDVNFPVTIDEQNNPAAQRCIDRNP